MTTHELAHKLLELPDVPIVVQGGSDPSDLVKATDVKLIDLFDYHSKAKSIQACEIS